VIRNRVWIALALIALPLAGRTLWHYRGFYRPASPIQVPAYAYVGFWIFFQVIGAAQQLAGVTNVSALAHLGGASVGLAAWILTRSR